VKWSVNGNVDFTVIGTAIKDYILPPHVSEWDVRNYKAYYPRSSKFLRRGICYDLPSEISNAEYLLFMSPYLHIENIYDKHCEQSLKMYTIYIDITSDAQQKCTFCPLQCRNVDGCTMEEVLPNASEIMPVGNIYRVRCPNVKIPIRIHRFRMFHHYVYFFASRVFIRSHHDLAVKARWPRRHPFTGSTTTRRRIRYHSV
jgi:hypothetical protein